MRKIIHAVLLFFLIVPHSVYSTATESIEYELIVVASHIVDGDTFYSDFSRFRLADIESPDSGDPGYSEAKSYISDLILDKVVWVDVDDYGSTSWNRLVCVIYVKHNETHLVNVNKMMVTSGHAVIDDHTDNEFDPSFWTDYVEIGCSLSGFSFLFEYEHVNVIYPSDDPGKPLVLGPAMLSDWTASGLILPRFEDFTEGEDTNSLYVNQATGKPYGESGEGVITFGGPDVNLVTYWAENTANAPIHFMLEGDRFYFKHSNGTDIPDASLPISVINFDEDMFVIEVFKDADGRYIMIIQGFGWKGSYAGGKFFEEKIYPDLESYPNKWIIVHWDDTNGDGFVNSPEDGDTYTVIATG